MSWWTAFGILIGIMVCAELMAIRGLINDLHEKINYNTDLKNKCRSLKWDVNEAVDLLSDVYDIVSQDPGHKDVATRINVFIAKTRENEMD